MNAAHIIGKKKNRLARLIRRLKDMPSDPKKLDRKNALINELGQAGVQHE
jgi:hypothetical protein